MDKALSLNEVANLLKLQHYRITYALATHRVPEPAIRVANKRVFQPVDIERIAEHFGITYPSVATTTTPANQPEHANAYTLRRRSL
jgi:hypothetical protein